MKGVIVGGIWGFLLSIILGTLGVVNIFILWQYWVLLVIPMVGFVVALDRD